MPQKRPRTGRRVLRESTQTRSSLVHVQVGASTLALVRLSNVYRSRQFAGPEPRPRIAIRVRAALSDRPSLALTCPR